MANISALARLNAKGGLVAPVSSGLAPVPEKHGEIFSHAGRLWVSGGGATKPALLPVGPAPISHSHIQAIAASTWTINHNFNLPGTPAVAAWDAENAPLEPIGVTVVSANQVIVAFGRTVAGSAVLSMPDSQSLSSLRLGGAALTFGSGKLAVNGTGLSVEGHGHAVSEVSGAAPLASPSFSGIPTAPTAAPSTNSTQLATTAFVHAVAVGVRDIRQQVYGVLGIYSGTAQITASATPTIASGSQIWSQSITMTTGNKLIIDIQMYADHSNNNRIVSFILFRETTPIAAVPVGIASSGFPTMGSFTLTDDGLFPGQTYTYSVRVGASGGGTWYVNQDKNGNNYGTVPTGRYRFIETI